MEQPRRYCVRCAEKLLECPASGDIQARCLTCGWVLYRDPKLVAGVLLAENGHVLLVQRDLEPGRGRWALPGGYVNGGEIVEEAAAREVWEETGLHVSVGSLLGLYSDRDDLVVLAVYVAERSGGALSAGIEVQDVAFWPVQSLPPLAFERDRSIVNQWVSDLPS